MSAVFFNLTLFVQCCVIAIVETRPVQAGEAPLLTASICVEGTLMGTNARSWHLSLNAGRKAHLVIFSNPTKIIELEISEKQFAKFVKLVESVDYWNSKADYGDYEVDGSNITMTISYPGAGKTIKISNWHNCLSEPSKHKAALRLMKVQQCVRNWFTDRCAVDISRSSHRARGELDWRRRTR